MAAVTREKRTGRPGLRVPPRPREKPLLGSVLEMRREGPLDFYIRMWREYGDVFHHHVGSIPVYAFIHPRDVEYVVATNEDGGTRDRDTSVSHWLRSATH